MQKKQDIFFIQVVHTLKIQNMMTDCSLYCLFGTRYFTYNCFDQSICSNGSKQSHLNVINVNICTMLCHTLG